MVNGKFIEIPSMEEFVERLKSESLPVLIIATADKVYYKADENESFYTNITQKVGKFGKALVFGLVGLGSMLIKHNAIRKAGALTLGYAIGDAIDKGLINKQFVIVKKTDNGLEFNLEGFDTSQNFVIYLNGTKIAEGTTDANGSAKVTVDGTVKVEATELAVVCGATTFHARIPWNITPSTTS